MLDSILIANRGEIAIRIIRACRLLNKRSIVLFSEEDSSSLHIKMANEAHNLGSGSIQDTYLNMDKILEIASYSDADAIHPGYGFLSESAIFAERIEKAGIKFIGPTSNVLNQLGDKMKAKKLAQEVEIPTVPGSDGYVSNVDEAEEVVEEIGYPIIIKSGFGGGGRGMEIVNSAPSLEISLLGCQTVSERFFGKKEVFIEKYIKAPRHVEIQFLSDNYGNTIHLGDRECSIQRAHQKIIEEAPSFLPSRQRNSLGKKVCALADNLSYTNAGTAEFLWKDKKLFFNEVNPRIQVEHPVTEMITGVDLIVQQLKIADDEELELKQEDIEYRGHAIEFRINAEDPLKSFYPQSGTVTNLTIPGGNNVRFDTYLYNSYKLPNCFDSLVGKLIIWGENRDETIERSRLALQELTISGITTNIPLHQAILENTEFHSRRITTDFLEIQKIHEIITHYEKMKLAAAFKIHDLSKEQRNPLIMNRDKRILETNRWKEQSKIEQQRKYP
ncbi:MAG: acetyl/propionyl/methylcrotonyl-CoA carboxylase subunit alpha [Candidatus Thorarchaeota archaeon]